MSYFYEEDEIQKIRDSNDIVDVISEYVSLKRTGQNYKGLCPFHNEKTPSFVVSSEKQIYHCFGCGAGGDVISFLTNYKNMDFKEALEELASRANITLNKKTYSSKKIDDKKLKLYEINREAAIYFYKKLRKSKNAVTYLKQRGINNDVVKKFGIGYASEEWEDLLSYLKSKNYDVVDIDRAGLLSTSRNGNKKFDRFRGRIIFPIWDVKSRIIGFGGRLIVNQENMPKYLNSPETDVFLKGINLYALNKARESIREKRYVIVVEGYMDVISLSIFGINNVVATLGTALTPEQSRLLKKYTDNIIIAYDSDSAGQRAAVKAAHVLVSEGISPKILTLGEGLDPDDFVNKYGGKKFKDKVEEAKHFIDFIISYNKNIYDLDDVEDKIKFVESVSEILRLIDSPVELDVYISRISEETRINPSSIKSQIKKTDNSNIYRKKEREATEENRDLNLLEQNQIDTNNNKAEEEILNIILTKTSYLERASLDLKSEWFMNYMNRKIFDYLNFLLEERDIMVAVDIDTWPDDLKKNAKKIFNMELNISEDDIERAYMDFVKKIKYENLLKEREKIMKNLSVMDSENYDNCRDLFIRITEIDKEMNKL